MGSLLGLGEAAGPELRLGQPAGLAARWVERGECDLDKAAQKLDWMLARIRLERARALAAPLHEVALVRLHDEVARADKNSGAHERRQRRTATAGGT